MADNVEIYRRLIETFNEQGLEGAMRYFDPGIEVYDPDLPEGTKVFGHDRVREVIGEMFEAWSSLRVEQVEIIPSGDRVLALTHLIGAGEGRRGEIRVEIRDAHLMTFRNGKIVYWRIYTDRREALQDAGLDPDRAVP